MNIAFLPADPSFAEIFFAWRKDAETVKFNPLAPSTIDVLRKRLASSGSNLDDFEKLDSFLWFVDFEGELAGQVNLQNINRMMLTAEIGYTIAPAARSKGVGTAALRLLTENAFARTPLRKLIAYKLAP
jgi:RimJ/RimL family protein N-acetyltransferase